LSSETRGHEVGISSNRGSARHGEASIRDELTVCHWEGARIGGNLNIVKQRYYIIKIIA